MTSSQSWRAHLGPGSAMGVDRGLLSSHRVMDAATPFQTAAPLLSWWFPHRQWTDPCKPDRRQLTLAVLVALVAADCVAATRSLVRRSGTTSACDVASVLYPRVSYDVLHAAWKRVPVADWYAQKPNRLDARIAPARSSCRHTMVIAESCLYLSPRHSQTLIQKRQC
jgi:hypothetical protein